MRATGLLTVVVAAYLASGCTHATCADYHQPGCWTQPPDASSADAEASDASDASVDDGAASDGGGDDATTDTDAADAAIDAP